MLKNRVIPVLILNDGQVVQSVRFRHTNIIHWNPSIAVDFFNTWGADEIIVLDVSRTKDKRDNFYWIVEDLSKKCFCPISVGGWIDSLSEANKFLKLGADKIIINTKAFTMPIFITKCSEQFGKQCVVISIDSFHGNVCINRGRTFTNASTISWSKIAEEHGAGELFINDINFDGNRSGYNLELLKSIVKSVSIPVIAMGGVLNWDHLCDGLNVGVSAVAAANQFHYIEQSTIKAKKYLKERNYNVR